MYDGGDASWVNSWEPLKNAVRVKGARYGELDKPLIVAVNFQGGYLDPIDEVQALYGQELVVVQQGNLEAPPSLEHDNNGAWRGRSGPEGRRVSAAWFFNNLLPYTAARSNQRIYLNPWAFMHVPESLECFPHSRLIDGCIKNQLGLEIGDILDLSSEWPEQ